MSDISQKKEMLKKVYPTSPTWPAKVDQMRDAQVIAIFLKLRSQRKV